MWAYVQRTGELFAANGELAGVGYAGYADHKNVPESEPFKKLGPLPRGQYRIQAPRTTQEHGPYVLPLEPDKATVMYGRAGMLIHGDSIRWPGTASTGCIIQARKVRERIWTSGDRDLMVVAEHSDLEHVAT